MKKLKNNQGYTLSIVLVIMIVLAIMTSTILFSVTAKTKSTTSIVSSELKKIELEKEAYKYLNSILLEENYTSDNFNITEEELNENDLIYSYVISYKDETQLLKLEIIVDFDATYSSYKITKWSYN